MATVSTHLDKWLRGLDLDFFEDRRDLAEKAFEAGWKAALGDKKAMAQAVAGDLEKVSPGMSKRLTGFVKKELNNR